MIFDRTVSILVGARVGGTKEKDKEWEWRVKERRGEDGIQLGGRWCLL